MIRFTHAPLFVPDSTRDFVCAMVDMNSLDGQPLSAAIQVSERATGIFLA